MNALTRDKPRLEAKVAIVTGGAGGIGQATCVAMAEEGAHVVAVDRPTPRLELLERTLAGSVAAGCEPGSMVLGLDVTSESDMAKMAELTLERFGRIDILVTCAGILRAPDTLPRPMTELTLYEWQVVIDVNLKGVFLSNRAVVPAMIEQRDGVILNVSSTSGRKGRAHDAPYCASKFGVVGLTESLAEEVRPRGIRVQTIFPDAVDTALWEQNGPIKPEIALAPERVADLIVYMVSLPADTLLVAPVIAPFKTRRRKKRVDAGEDETAFSARQLS